MGRLYAKHPSRSARFAWQLKFELGPSMTLSNAAAARVRLVRDC
jgi:hypothetical protein